MLDQAEESPYTSVKVLSERTSNGQRAGQVEIPRRVLRMREVSQEDALESVGHFSASGNCKGAECYVRVWNGVSCVTSPIILL